MTEIFVDLLYTSLIIWIDDLLGHAPTEDGWFSTLEKTLHLANSFNLKLNIEKCNLFLREVKFCGRIFRPDGVSHDPNRVKALCAMNVPEKENELQQLLMASQWMSRSIPEYNKIVSPLQDIFELAMKNQPRRTKGVARSVRLKQFGWNVKHTLAVERLKLALANIIQLSYPDEEMIQCVFCDASYNCSSGMVTQIPAEDSDKSVSQQRHELLGFVGHRFNGSELNWATVDKEAFAIVDTLRKLTYVLHMPRPFRIYTDHRNLISIYNPKKCSKQSAERLIRWGVEIREFNFTIHHIPGEDNVWADLLSRWGAVKEMALSRIGVRAVTTIPESQANNSFQLEDPMAQFRIQPLAPEKFVWPDVAEIANEQRMFMPHCGLSTNDEGLFIDDRNHVGDPNRE